MKFAVLFTIITMFFPGPAPPCHAQNMDKVDQVRGQALGAVNTRAKTQELINRFIHQEAELKDRIDTLKAELDLASKHRRKTQAYVDSQQAALDEVNRQIKEAEKIKTKLDPLLDEACRKLNDQSGECPPWEVDVVKGRMAEVKRVLDDYEAGPAAKVLAVLKELRRRVALANTVSVHEKEIEIDSGLIRASLFRLGGLSWYALSMDGRWAWIWNRADQAFKSVDQAADQLHKAVEIAEKHRVISLIELPLDQIPATRPQSEAKEKAHE